MKRARILLLIQFAASLTRNQSIERQENLPSFLHGIDSQLLPLPPKFNLFRPSSLASFDLILITYTEPAQNYRRDVLQICHELRQQFDGPLLLISSVTDEAFQRASYAVGIDEYIKETTTTRKVMLAKLGVWYNWSIAASQKGYAGTGLYRQLLKGPGIAISIAEWPAYMSALLNHTMQSDQNPQVRSRRDSRGE